MLSLTNYSPVVYSPSGRYGLCEGVNEQIPYEGNFCKFFIADLKKGKKYEVKLVNDFEWILYPWNNQFGYFSYRVHHFYWLTDEYLVICCVNRFYIEDELHILYRIDLTKRNKQFEQITDRKVAPGTNRNVLRSRHHFNYLTIEEIVNSNDNLIHTSKPNIIKRIWQFVKKLFRL